MSLDALVRLHEGLARLGPGLPETTRAAVERCRPFLPDHPRVADVGCGTGAATLAGVIVETRTEAAFYAAHGDAYGYVFCILRSPGPH